MKITYTHADPYEVDIKESYNSIESFVRTLNGKIFKEFLTKDRLNCIDKITIETNYPSVITISIEH